MNVIIPTSVSTPYSQMFSNLKITFNDINYNFNDISFIEDSRGVKHLFFDDFTYFPEQSTNFAIPLVSTSLNQLPKSVVKRLEGKKVMVLNDFSEKVLKKSCFEGEICKTTIFNNINVFKKYPKMDFGQGERFVFLTFCNFNHPKWSQVIKSYFKAFEKGDSVLLVAVFKGSSWSRYQQAEIIAQINAIKQKMNKKTPEMIFIGSKMTNPELFSAYNGSDCFVKLYSSTGLSHLNAMAANLPCIGPETGPCRQFLNNNNGFLIKKQKEDKLFSRNELNGMPYDIYCSKQLISTMKYVYDNRKTVKENFFKERRITVSKFDRSVVVPQLISTYNSL